MNLRVTQVNAFDFAHRASEILNHAWPAPAFYYTPEYLRWQFGFSTERSAGCGVLAMAAFDGTEPIGFAAITPRRMRRGLSEWDAGIVSFVAVLPEWQGMGVSSKLYSTLLAAARVSGLQLITFTIPQSGGQRALLKAYALAGFRTHPLGRYPVYGSMVRSDSVGSLNGWQTEYCDQPTPDLAEVAAGCALDTRIVWSSPTDSQASHYFNDPRPRRLVLIRKNDTLLGAAWVVRTQFRSPQEVHEVTTLESVLLPRTCADALPALMRAAAHAWAESPESAIVNAPNLYGFDPVALRKAGIRQTPTVFEGYLCGADLPPALIDGAEGTNLEII